MPLSLIQFLNAGDITQSSNAKQCAHSSPFDHTATSGSPFGSVEPVFFKTARKDFRWFQPWNEQPAVWPTPEKGTLALFNCNYGYGRNALEKTKRKAEEAGLRCTATTNRPMVLVEFD